MKIGIYLLASLMVSSTALAQSSSCESFDTSIEGSLKAIAMSKADGFTDNSAPRATLRQLKMSNEMALISTNLMLQAANKCAPRKSPINPNKYFGEALTCALAEAKNESDPVSCKQVNWTGEASNAGAPLEAVPAVLDTPAIGTN